MLGQKELLVTERIQYKLQRAVEDPDYRLKLLAEGDPDLDDIIVAALRAVELVFRTAGAAAGVSWFIKPLHSKKANHQRCSIELV